MLAGIYKITNKINNKIYIGSSVNIKSRWSTHINTKKGFLISLAIKKYGIDNFIFEIIEQLDLLLTKEVLRESLIETEQKYLDLFQPWPENNGYNLCRIAGSTLGTTRTEQQRKNISEAKKAQNLKGSKSPRSIPVYMLDPVGNIVFFESINSGALEYDLHVAAVAEVIRGIRYQYKGWRLYNKNEVGHPPINKKAGKTPWNKGKKMDYAPKSGKTAKGVKRPWQLGRKHRKTFDKNLNSYEGSEAAQINNKRLMKEY